MKENYYQCNFIYSDVLEASIPYTPLSLTIRQKTQSLKQFISGIVRALNNPETPEIEVQQTKTDINTSTSENEVLNLNPGEWVEVRSFDEISATLDQKGKYKGLYFMPEMKRYCGKKFKVFKKVEIIKLESTGELRKLRSPSVFLEGVYCHGENHDNCDRSCFHFWREIWLKRVKEG